MEDEEAYRSLDDGHEKVAGFGIILYRSLDEGSEGRGGHQDFGLYVVSNINMGGVVTNSLIHKIFPIFHKSK